MEYQKNKLTYKGKPKSSKKISRDLWFQGYYVEVRAGEDAIRAYRKIKRWIKEDNFIEQIKNSNTYRKPSEIRVEKKPRNVGKYLENYKENVMTTCS